VLAAGAVGSPALLLRSRLPGAPPRIGAGFTCHPALILVAEHARPITNDVGHPKSFFVDRAAEEGFVLETCMYFPFTTAKALTGFGAGHSAMMRAFPRLQQILVLAVDHATPENRIAVDRAGTAVVHYRFTRMRCTVWCRGTARRRGYSSRRGRCGCMLRSPTRPCSPCRTRSGSTGASPSPTGGLESRPSRRPI
jgi:hypothetical protein